MDIIYLLGKYFWELMVKCPYEIVTFIVRYDLILFYCIIFAYLSMLLFRRGILTINTLPVQVLSVFLGIIFGMATHLDFIRNMSLLSRNILLMISICLWIILPHTFVRYQVRRLGLKTYALKIIFTIALITLIIQILFIFIGGKHV